jgi:hypothetical protein
MPRDKLPAPFEAAQTEPGTQPGRTAEQRSLPDAPDAKADVAFAATQLGPNTLDSATDLTGAVIAGRYEIVRRIGKGGMGEVYLALHRTLGSHFAVKVMKRAGTPEDAERFLRKAQIASKLSHQNTVYIADFGVLPDGRSFLAMEFLRGRTLAEVIKKQPLSQKRACAIAAQIAHGLSAVHAGGIIHRAPKHSHNQRKRFRKFHRGNAQGTVRYGQRQCRVCAASGLRQSASLAAAA